MPAEFLEKPLHRRLVLCLPQPALQRLLALHSLPLAAKISFASVLARGRRLWIAHVVLCAGCNPLILHRMVSQSFAFARSSLFVIPEGNLLLPFPVNG